MSKEEFIAKLQMVYVGDRNAFNELVQVYDNLLQKNSKAIEKLYCWGEALNSDFQKEMLSILKEEELENEE